MLHLADCSQVVVELELLHILDNVDVVLCIPYTDIVRPPSEINDGVGFREKIERWRGVVRPIAPARRADALSGKEKTATAG